MPKTDDGKLHKPKPKPEAGHPNPYSKERWKWKDKDNKNGKKAKKKSRKKFLQALALMELEAGSAGNGMLISGRDIRAVMGKIEVHKVLGAGVDKLWDLDRHLLQGRAGYWGCLINVGFGL